MGPLEEYFNQFDNTFEEWDHSKHGWMIPEQYTERSEQIGKFERFIHGIDELDGFTMIHREIYDNSWEDPDGEYHSKAIFFYNGKVYSIMFNLDSWNDMGSPALDWKTLEVIAE